MRPVDLPKHLLLSRQGVGKHHVLSHIVCRWGVQLCYCAGLKHEPVDLPLYLMIAYGGEWEVNVGEVRRSLPLPAGLCAPSDGTPPVVGRVGYVTWALGCPASVCLSTSPEFLACLSVYRLGWP